MTNENSAIWFVDRHVREGRAEKPVFIEAGDGGRTLTYGELAAQSAQMGGLSARHGISREQRAAVLVLDTIEFPVIFWGSLKAGIVPVALNTLLSTDVYRTILQDSRAAALFVSAPLLPLVQPLFAELPFLKTVFVVGGNAPEGAFDFGAELAKSGAAPVVDVCADECAFWLYSSGSTGQPKGVRHVHGSLQATADTYGAQVLGIREDDVVHSAAKFFFAYGLGNSMSFPMSVGATTIINAGRPTPDGVTEILRTYKPTIFCGVPTLYAALCQHLEPQGGLGIALRRCISAGEALPAEVGKRWKQLAGCDILDGVGSTEMLHIFLSNSPESLEYGTSGIPVPGYEVRLVDEQDTEVGPGQVGELLVKGASAASDYWNQRDKSRTTFQGEWTRTGDKYQRTETGRYVYCGRTDDMFKVSGIWVSPFEVEQALIAHPSVLEAAVVSACDEEGLEKPKAFVVLKQGQTGDAAALKAHVQESIGKWKYPRWIEFVPDLPKTATGKIQRFKLRG